jgi:hypothetical protein
MANISSYPLITPKASDLILVTETYDINAASPVTGNPTRSATVASVVTLPLNQAPHVQVATAASSAVYTESNDIVYITWSGVSGTYVYTLPSATAIPYRTIRFVNGPNVSSSDKIHVTAPGVETIDGVAFYTLKKPYRGISIWSNGTEWIVIQAKS